MWAVLWAMPRCCGGFLARGLRVGFAPPPLFFSLKFVGRFVVVWKGADRENRGGGIAG